MNIVSIMLAVGFFTLLERKLLAFSQIRSGPNKPGVFGVFQPLLDALKLLKKQPSLNFKMNKVTTFLFSFFMLLLMLLLWLVLPFKSWVSSKSLGMLWILALVGVSSFSILMLGWLSLGKYSALGSIRSVSQILTLEIVITMILFMSFMSINSTSVNKIITSFSYIAGINGLFFFMVVLLETHRAPFDLSEGESELVSGYNTEFSSILFMLIFLSEYGNLLFFSFLTSWLFSTKTVASSFVLITVLLSIRTCFPRLRYDLMMGYTWLKVLPSTIFLSLFILTLKIV